MTIRLDCLHAVYLEHAIVYSNACTFERVIDDLAPSALVLVMFLTPRRTDLDSIHLSPNGFNFGSHIIKVLVKMSVIHLVRTFGIDLNQVRLSALLVSIGEYRLTLLPVALVVFLFPSVL